MKYFAPGPFADPAVAARKLLEIANATVRVRLNHQRERVISTVLNGIFWNSPTNLGTAQTLFRRHVKGRAR